MGPQNRSTNPSSFEYSAHLDPGSLAELSPQGTMDLAVRVQGPWSKPAVFGQLLLNQVGFSIPLSRLISTLPQSQSEETLSLNGVSGGLYFTPQRWQLKDFTGELNQVIRWSLSGEALEPLQSLAEQQRPSYSAEFKTEAFDLVAVHEAFQDLLPNVQATPGQPLAPLKPGDLSGEGKLTFTLKNAKTASFSQPFTPGYEGELTLSNLQVRSPRFSGEALALNTLTILANHQTGLTLPEAHGQFGPIGLNAKAHVPANPKTPIHIDIATDWMSVKILQTHPHLITALTGSSDGISPPSPTQASGQMKVLSTWNGPANHLTGETRFLMDNITVGWSPGLPIEAINGSVALSLEGSKAAGLNTQDLYFTIGQYQFRPHLSGRLLYGQTNPLSSTSTSTPWNPELSAVFDMPITFRRERPSDDLNTKVSQEEGRVTGSLTLKDDRLELAQGLISAQSLGEIEFNGVIEHWLNPEQRGSKWSVQTPKPLDLKGLNTWLPQAPPSSGSIDLQLTANGHSRQDSVFIGQVVMDSVRIPALRVLDLDSTLIINGIQGAWDVSHLNLPGVDVGLNATIDDIAEFPWQLSNVEIQGKQFILPAWDAYQRDIINSLVMKQFVIPLFGPPKPTDPLVAVEFSDAHLALDEVVYNNIIIKDVEGQMGINRSGFLTLHNAQGKVTSGDVKLNLSLDPLNNQFTSIDLTAHQLNTNALMTALLNASNQVFGKMDGTIQVTTEGLTDVDMVKNTNGAVSFSIADGRLPAIAKIETLLAAANVLRGGVTGINLNNLFRSLEVFNTNYFAELSGHLNLNHGIAYTDDVLSDSENLDLLIQGNLDLSDAYGNLKVYGTMSQNVSGTLGHLGNLSFNSLLKYIPGIGFIPGSERGGLLSYIPGVGFVPGLGTPGKDRNRFKVTIEGPMTKAEEAVKGFEWLP